jgi:hypothetical protein
LSETDSVANPVSNGPTVPAPDDKSAWSIVGMTNGGTEQNFLEKNLTQYHVCTTNPTWASMEFNAGQIALWKYSYNYH